MALRSHIEDIVGGVLAYSRTAATGLVDTSASAHKMAAAQSSQAGLQDARQAVIKGTTAAINLLEHQSPTDVSDSLLLHVNRLMVAGSYPKVAFRDFDVDAYGYIRSGEVRQDCGRFVCRLNELPRATDKAEVLDALFDVHWSINLRGHYFYDACGRTAVVVGSWITDWMTGEFIQLPPRAQYLGVASAAAPRDAWVRLLCE